MFSSYASAHIKCSPSRLGVLVLLNGWLNRPRHNVTKRAFAVSYRLRLSRSSTLLVLIRDRLSGEYDPTGFKTPPNDTPSVVHNVGPRRVCFSCTSKILVFINTEISFVFLCALEKSDHYGWKIKWKLLTYEHPCVLSVSWVYLGIPY